MTKYYIQEIQGKFPKKIDLEATYKGVFVKDVVGLLNKGKRKDVYTETFADKKGVKRVTGTTPLFEPTKVKLVLVILEDNFIETYTSLLEYLFLQKSFYLHDTLRNKKVELYVESAISPNDIHIVGQERIEVEIECINPNGEYYPIN